MNYSLIYSLYFHSKRRSLNKIMTDFYDWKHIPELSNMRTMLNNSNFETDLTLTMEFLREHSV